MMQVCTYCEVEYSTDEEEPICYLCSGTMMRNENKEDLLEIIRHFMEWSNDLDVGTVMEALMFLTVIECKNRSIPTAYFMRRLVEKWQELDLALGQKEVGEA